jgi:hypothetical protein
MTLSADTATLSDAEILHLLRTLAPGIPPGLDHPPLPPDTLTPPPWPAHPPTAHPGHWIALAGGLGLLALWGIARGGSPPITNPAIYPTLAPGAVYAAGVPAMATISPLPTLAPTLAATAFPSATPTLPPAPPTDVPTMVPPTAMPVRAAVPVYRPKPPTAMSVPVLPPPAPTTQPSPVGGSGDWGNDWSGSIFDRSATIKAPTPAP